MNAALAALLTAVLLAPHGARAQGAPSSAAAETDDPTLLAIQSRLGEDPAFAGVVAQRIDRSQLAGIIAPTATDPADRLKAVKAWVAGDPNSASRLAVGLFGDDAAGTHDFEDNLVRQTTLTPVDNTKSNRGVLWQLRNVAHFSDLIKRQSQNLSDDEKRELLRTLFEGNGAQTNSVLNQAGGDVGGPGAAAGPGVGTGGVTAGFAGYYDRLGAGNLHGYSPQLLALQSSLNQRRAPGAPALIETGKLDYATLAYPAYAMDYDVRGLEARLRRERLLALARLAGVTLSARDLKDPDLEKKLLAKIPADRLPARLARRAALNAKARAALDAFLAAAARAKDPAKISRRLLVELSRLQAEAARWITAAALEEDLSRLDELDGFLTPELLAQIASAPAPDAARAGYRDRGTELEARLTAARADAQAAQDALTGPGWAAALVEISRRIASERAARAELTRDIPLYSRVPYRLAESAQVQARWRVWLDDLALQWLPTSDYARAVAARRARFARWGGIFERISRSELSGAAADDAQLEPPAP